jgi:pantoate--beta-alanine ligase
MQVVNSISQLKRILYGYREQNRSIGFVPTMGALHKGHISLVSFSNHDNDVTIVSIFVNPTQFNDKKDLKNYPRTLGADLAILEQNEVDIVFAPSESEMYPEPDNRVFDFGNLDKVMEGARRPGHFNGVAQIVSKFFAVVEPDKAYFGEKDFQQLTIIKQLVRQLNFQLQVISCPIVRENDGLAMSSRNVLLLPNQRKEATHISKTLFESQKLADNYEIEKLKAWVIDTVNKNSELEVEYFEIVDDINLMPVNSWKEQKKKVGCIAVKVGNLRLIDNIRYLK